MLINLYYIEGISRIDTPYFATKTIQASLQKQEEFFDNHLVHQVELGYYPPHYRNTIRFDDDDLVINDSVNYLSLDYQGKRYYYFIDTIEYISESIIEISVTMDVIQTYMFDIYISNGIIERKFINRWSNSNKIIRDYIRENVSVNEYVYDSHNVINSDMNKWLVFAPVSSFCATKQTTENCMYNIKLPGNILNKSIPASFISKIYTYSNAYYTGQFYRESEGAIVTESSITDGNFCITGHLGEMCSDNLLVNMYVCPFNCLQEVSIEFVGTKNTVSFSTYSWVKPCQKPYEVHGQNFKNLYMVTGQDPYNFNTKLVTGALDLKLSVLNGSLSIGNFDKNAVVGTNYDSKYITQMLDENYIRLKYGSLGTYTSFPLYYLKTKTLWYYAAFNPNDGTRTYWLSDDSNAYDTYNTVVIDNNVIYFDMKNDPWKEYQAANRGRWVAAGATTAVDVFSKVMTMAIGAGYANNEIASIKANPRMYDKRYKLPTLKSKPSKQVQSLKHTMAEDITSGALGIFGDSSNMLQQGIKDVNVMCQPPTPKQIANLSGISAKDGYIMYYIEKANDYEQCAQYYHRNGFLVNEYINAKDNIFNYVFNRYYFNMLKMSIPNVHLHHVIEDEETCEAIADRLVDGVRLWNVNNTGVVIGDFSKDNVELDYLS